MSKNLTKVKIELLKNLRLLNNHLVEQSKCVLPTIATVDSDKQDSYNYAFMVYEALQKNQLPCTMSKKKWCREFTDLRNQAWKAFSNQPCSIEDLRCILHYKELARRVLLCKYLVHLKCNSRHRSSNKLVKQNSAKETQSNYWQEYMLLKMNLAIFCQNLSCNTQSLSSENLKNVQQIGNHFLGSALQRLEMQGDANQCNLYEMSRPFTTILHDLLAIKRHSDNLEDKQSIEERTKQIEMSCDWSKVAEKLTEFVVSHLSKPHDFSSTEKRVQTVLKSASSIFVGMALITAMLGELLNYSAENATRMLTLYHAFKEQSPKSWDSLKIAFVEFKNNILKDAKNEKLLADIKKKSSKASIDLATLIDLPSKIGNDDSGEDSNALIPYEKQDLVRESIDFVAAKFPFLSQLPMNDEWMLINDEYISLMTQYGQKICDKKFSLKSASKSKSSYSIAELLKLWQQTQERFKKTQFENSVSLSKPHSFAVAKLALEKEFDKYEYARSNCKYRNTGIKQLTIGHTREAEYLLDCYEKLEESDRHTLAQLKTKMLDQLAKLSEFYQQFSCPDLHIFGLANKAENSQKFLDNFLMDGGENHLKLAFEAFCPALAQFEDELMQRKAAFAITIIAHLKNKDVKDTAERSEKSQKDASNQALTLLDEHWRKDFSKLYATAIKLKRDHDRFQHLLQMADLINLKSSNNTNTNNSSNSSIGNNSHSGAAASNRNNASSVSSTSSGRIGEVSHLARLTLVKQATFNFGFKNAQKILKRYTKILKGEDKVLVKNHENVMNLQKLILAKIMQINKDFEPNYDNLEDLDDLDEESEEEEEVVMAIGMEEEGEEEEKEIVETMKDKEEKEVALEKVKFGDSESKDKDAKEKSHATSSRRVEATLFDNNSASGRSKGRTSENVNTGNVDYYVSTVNENSTKNDKKKSSAESNLLGNDKVNSQNHVPSNIGFDGSISLSTSPSGINAAVIGSSSAFVIESVSMPDNDNNNNNNNNNTTTTTFNAEKIDNLGIAHNSFSQSSANVADANKKRSSKLSSDKKKTRSKTQKEDTDHNLNSKNQQNPDILERRRKKDSSNNRQYQADIDNNNIHYDHHDMQDARYEHQGQINQTHSHPDFNPNLQYADQRIQNAPYQHQDAGKNNHYAHSIDGRMNNVPQQPQYPQNEPIKDQITQNPAQMRYDLGHQPQYQTNYNQMNSENNHQYQNQQSQYQAIDHQRVQNPSYNHNYYPAQYQPNNHYMMQNPTYPNQYPNHQPPAQHPNYQNNDVHKIHNYSYGHKDPSQQAQYYAYNDPRMQNVTYEVQNNKYEHQYPNHQSQHHVYQDPARHPQHHNNEDLPVNNSAHQHEDPAQHHQYYAKNNQTVQNSYPYQSHQAQHHDHNDPTMQKPTFQHQDLTQKPQYDADKNLETRNYAYQFQYQDHQPQYPFDNYQKNANYAPPQHQDPAQNGQFYVYKDSTIHNPGNYQNGYHAQDFQQDPRIQDERFVAQNPQNIAIQSQNVPPFTSSANEN